MTNDATIEKIAEILRDNPDGLLLYRDELMGWLRSLDKAGREADRAFYLEAWNGNGSFSVDRIGRGSLHVPAVCVSVLGGIQPGPLSTYVRDALGEAEKADGLLQRFQLLVHPDPRGYDPVDRRPDLEAKNRAYDVFKGLAGLDAEAFGARRGGGRGPVRPVRQRSSGDLRRLAGGIRAAVSERRLPGRHREPLHEVP